MNRLVRYLIWLDLGPDGTSSSLNFCWLALFHLDSNIIINIAMFRALLFGATATVVLCLVFYRPSFSFGQADHCECDPATKDPEAHGELISVLSELLILLDALVAIEPGTVLWPEPNTGCHPPGTINTTAATAAGYNPEAVRLMHSLPYLEDWEFEIGHDTHLIAYDWRDEDGFREERVMLYDDDNLMPASAVQITRGESLYGLYRIYDTQKSNTAPTLHWKPLHARANA